jgi:hypothetical protein
VKRFLTAFVAAIALLLITGVGLRASPLPPDQISWSYNWTPGAPAVFSDKGTGAGVTFTNEPTKVAVGSSDIVATNLRVFSSATATAPDMITGSNGNYKLTLQLSVNDNGTPFTQTLTFTGKLFTTAPKGFSSQNANVQNMFLVAGPQVADLGTIRFTVQLMAYTPPGPPDQSNAGSISAHVTVENITPTQVPEPSAIVLGGMGLTFFGGAAWRRLRKARVPA